MITLVQNSPNLVVATLNERKRLCTGIYLLEFIDPAKTKNYSIVTDLLQNNRYNKFILNVVTGSANSGSGEINLPLTTQYTYNIYENPSSSFSPSGLWNCETGIAKVQAQKTESVHFTGSIVTPIYQINGI